MAMLERKGPSELSLTYVHALLCFASLWLCQLFPVIHEENCDHQVKEGDSALLVHSHETPTSSVQFWGPQHKIVWSC